MNTTQLDCFMAVANYLNFSRAAEHLRLSQPAVSHQINALEDELDVKLFQRTSKSVRLTQEGYLFLQYAGEILKLSAQSKARLKESKRVLATRLTIGCRSTAELHLIRPALKRLRETNPAVVPDLRMIPFDSLENLLEEGDIHVMFSFGRERAKKLRYHELAHCGVACICSPSHPLATHDQLTVAELQTADRIAVSQPPICPTSLFHIQTRIIGERSSDQILFCGSQEVIHTMVETGYAFAVATDFPHLRTPGLKYIPLFEFEPLSFGAMYKERTPVIQSFFTLLEESLKFQAMQSPLPS